MYFSVIYKKHRAQVMLSEAHSNHFRDNALVLIYISSVPPGTIFVSL